MLAVVARELSFHSIERVLLESNSHQRTKSLDRSLVLQIVCRQLPESYQAQRNAIRFVQDKLGGVDIGWRFFHEFALNWIRRARIGLRVRGRDRWNLIPTIQIAGIVTSGMRRRKSKVCARSLQDSQASLVTNLRLHSGLLQRRWTSMKKRLLR